MPWPVYSERLLYQINPNAWATYVVPSGHRAIIKNATSVNWQTVASQATIRASGLYVAIIDFPASISYRSIDLMFVVYGGGTIEIFHTQVGIQTSVHGWLLDDTVKRAEQLPAIDEPPASAAPPPWLTE